MLRFEEKQSSEMEDSAKDDSMDMTKESHVELSYEDDKVQQLASDHEEEEADVGNDVEFFKSEHTRQATSSIKDWRRVRKVYRRSKQYIFVAATLPGSGKKTAGGVLKRMFPDATWVSGNYLHCHNPRCATYFLSLFCLLQYHAVPVSKQVSFCYSGN